MVLPAGTSPQCWGFLLQDRDLWLQLSLVVISALILSETFPWGRRDCSGTAGEALNALALML